MEVYSNESANEQLSTLKYFLLRNGKLIVLAAVIVIFVFAGWQYSISRSNKLMLKASIEYNELMDKLEHGELYGTLQKNNGTSKEIIEKVSNFIKENHNNYGSLAALRLAKTLVENKDLTGANQALEQGLNDSKDSELLAILNIRLARIQFATNKNTAALASLDRVKGENWQALVADIRGDIFAKQGEKQAARAAWSKGIVSALTPALKQMMQTKLNNLG